MSQALDRQSLGAISGYAPKSSRENPIGWVLIAQENLVRVFSEFSDAVKYADENFPEEQVLIRHTSEQRGTIPFVILSQAK